MTTLIVKKSPDLNGQIWAPSSKSQSIRGLLFALLSRGNSRLNNLLESDDVSDALNVVQTLGAKVTWQNQQLLLHSQGLPLMMSKPSIHSGNSGITTHFILPLLGLRQSDEPIILDSGDQMRARPIHALVQALKPLGLEISYLKEPCRLPVEVKGHLNGGTTEIEGLTSQYISALLIALPLASKDSHVTVHHLHERPYMEMTLRWLDQQNIHYQHNRHATHDVFHIQGKQQYQSFETSINGDFSSASYLIAAAVLSSGVVELKGLDMEDPQGDKRLINILQAMGANIQAEKHRLLIRGGQPLQGMTIDANDIPDLLPTLAVIGSQALGKTEIVNTPHARIKETDRIHAMVQGLSRLSAKIEEKPDGLVIYQSKLQGNQVHGYGDHRTMMALGLAGLFADHETVIEGSEAIHKTFPSFVSKMQALGADMKEVP